MSLDRLKLILEAAIKDEEYAYALYSKGAEVSNDDEIKETLLELAEQEKLHKEKLETLSLKKVGGAVIADKITAIEINSELALVPLEQFETLIEMLEFALKQEVMAKNLYLNLANSTNDHDSKKLFLMLSEEEAKHEEIVKEKLRDISSYFG